MGSRKVSVPNFNAHHPLPPLSRPSLPFSAQPLPTYSALPHLPLPSTAPVRSQLPDGSGSATGGRASKTKRPRRAPPRNLALSSVQNPTSPPPHQPNSFCMDENWSFGGDDNNGWENFDSASAREENAPESVQSTFPLERSTQPAPERVVDEVEDYLGMLFRENAAIVVRIDSRMWVMEGVKDGVPDFGMFYHVTLYEGMGPRGTTERLSSCDCIEGRGGIRCIHQRTMQVHASSFLNMQAISNDVAPPAILFAPAMHGRSAWFSVLSTRRDEGAISLSRHDQKRCIVSQKSSRQWYCAGLGCIRHGRDPSSCVHRQRAHGFAKHTLQIDSDEEENGEDDEDLSVIKSSPANAQGHAHSRPCSHKPVPPPIFTRLDSDPPRIEIPPIPSLPSPIPLGPHPRCHCGREGDMDAGVDERECRVFHSRGILRTRIQVQSCSCRLRGERRTIGPDLGALGLFNWNNEIVITHELLNSYTSQFTCSPTPLSAFCSTVQHAYEENSPPFDKPPKFLARSTFIKVFFAFVQLQEMDVSFRCPVCGPTPSTVIADGVVLAHSTRLRHENLRPPTATSSRVVKHPPSAIIIPFLPSKMLRQRLKECAAALSSEVTLQSDAIAQFKASWTDHLASHKPSPIIASWIASLLALLPDIFAYVKIYPRLQHPYEYLLTQLAAEEGIFQCCRPLCRPILIELASPSTLVSSSRYSTLATTLCRRCPALGLLMQCHQQQPSEGPIKICPSLRTFLSSTAAYVQHQGTILCGTSGTSTSAPIETLNNHSYSQTGCYYGGRKHRQRPVYGGIDAATNRDSTTAREEGCRKYYDAYVKQRRTGGIMALWCPHSVCIGFHIIPEAEGRNDVFSALFSYWEKAPEVVVYDFACQLASYCIRRESAFFQDTLFVIDQMHQYGHSKCSASSFLSSYMPHDPDLQQLNSSAAECGNAALGRIKKSVSYCGQEHAVLLIKHFLCVWNRLRIRKHLKKRREGATREGERAGRRASISWNDAGYLRGAGGAGAAGTRSYL